MTMQVAMVGRDGIIIASDRKVTREAHLKEGQIGNEIDAPCHEWKIEYSKERNIAISCSGDIEAARGLAAKIISELSQSDLGDEYTAAQAIERIGESTLEQDRYKIRCLIALKCPDWKLFTYTQNPSDKCGGISCESAFDGWEIAGHLTNPAIFLVRKYFEEDAQIAQLIPFAGFVVLSAGELNPECIGGLDVIRCDELGVRRLSRGAISELKEIAKGWRTAITKLFAECNCEFDYAPD